MRSFILARDWLVISGNRRRNIGPISSQGHQNGRVCRIAVLHSRDVAGGVIPHHGVIVHANSFPPFAVAFLSGALKLAKFLDAWELPGGLVSVAVSDFGDHSNIQAERVWREHVPALPEAAPHHVFVNGTNEHGSKG